MSRAVWWEPQRLEAHTVALFHLDDAVREERIDVEELLKEKGGAELPALERPKNSVANAVRTGGVATYRGACQFVARGRFGGGLRFADRFTTLTLPPLGSLPNRTIEFWLRLDAMPPDDAVLLHCSASPGAKEPPLPVSLRINPNGELILNWRGTDLAPTKARCPAGKWLHLALSWGEAEARLCLNGRVEATYAELKGLAEAAGLDLCTIGDGKSGFVGLVDEVLVSRRVQDYYENQLDWPQPNRERAATQGRPYWRDPADLLFHLTFDKALKPAVAPAGTKAPDYRPPAEGDATQTAAKHFLPGVVGSALIHGNGGLAPEYAAPGLLSPECGTIAFWLRPLEWDNYTRDTRFDRTNPRHVPLFRVLGERQSPLLTFVLIENPSEEAFEPVPFDPGRWTHIAVTWDGTQIATLINGEPRASGGAFDVRIEKKGTPLSLSFGHGEGNAPRSLVDDFRIYRRALARVEIANLIALHDPRRKLEPLPPAELTIRPNGPLGTVEVSAVPLVPGYAQVEDVMFRLIELDSGSIFPDHLMWNTGKASPLGPASCVLKTEPLRFGDYLVKARLFAAGSRVLGDAEAKFTFAKPPWWGSKAGLSDKVMPGWDPIAVKGNVVSVCLRDIHLAPSGLPAKIVAAGEDILAGPVQVLAEGIEYGTKGEGLRFKKQTDVRADWEGVLDGPGWSLKVNAYVEYDGMMWFDFGFWPGRGVSTPEKLAVRIPYRAQAAEMVHWWSGEAGFRDPRVIHIGALPTSEGLVFASTDRKAIRHPEGLRGNFIPYLMLAGDERGMAFFAENDKGWTQSDGVPALAVERKGDVVTLTLNVIATKPAYYGAGWFSFGLHPIPTKRLPVQWRRHVGWTVFPDTFSGNNLKGEAGPTAFNIVPDKCDWEMARQRLGGLGRGKGAAGILALHRGHLEQFRKRHGREPRHLEVSVPGLYWDMQWTGHFPDHTRDFASTWWRPGDLVHYKPTFIDYCSWAQDLWITETDKAIRGIYYDDCWGSPLRDPDSGVAYKLPDGAMQPGYQFRAFRERFRRSRQVFYDRGVEPQICAHTTHTFLLPYHSFFDVILDGEDFYSTPPHQGDFIDHWPPDRLRFMNNRKFGLITEWLGWTGGGTQTKLYPAWTFRQQRAYAAALGLVDIRWEFSDGGFGITEDDVQFIPYWAGKGDILLFRGGKVECPLFQHGHGPDLKASAWRRPGKCLVLLANLGKERIEATVVLSAEAMGFAPGQQVIARDVDDTLLTYFDYDVTKVTKPKAKSDVESTVGPRPDDGLHLDERAEDLTPAERRAKDPDGKLTWEAGTLRCPVRPHDYRILLFAPK